MSGGAKLAITGATGFVGQAVLDALDGSPVKALARREQVSRKGAEWISGSLADGAALDELASGCEAMIHIAGLTNTPNPADFEEANVTGTANVIAACKKAGCKRLIFVSSLSARKPELSEYGASKARAEELVKASKLNWTIVRPPAVYGPRDDDMLDLFRSAKWGMVPLPPGGATSIIYVDDLAKLLITLTIPENAKPSQRKIFEPDDGREGGWAHKELAQGIAEAMGKRNVLAPHLPRSVLSFAASADRLFRGDRAKLTPDRVGYMCHPNWVARSDRKVPSEIWQAEVAGAQGFAKTAEWYRARGWL